MLSAEDEVGSGGKSCGDTGCDIGAIPAGEESILRLATSEYSKPPVRAAFEVLVLCRGLLSVGDPSDRIVPPTLLPACSFLLSPLVLRLSSLPLWFRFPLPDPVVPVRRFVKSVARLNIEGNTTDCNHCNYIDYNQCN